MEGPRHVENNKKRQYFRSVIYASQMHAFILKQKRKEKERDRKRDADKKIKNTDRKDSLLVEAW